VTPETARQQGQPGNLVHCLEVRVARSLEKAADQIGAVGSDDRNLAPQLDRSHYTLDGREPAISSTHSEHLATREDHNDGHRQVVLRRPMNLASRARPRLDR
jgi:hypothetical protein